MKGYATHSRMLYFEATFRVIQILFSREGMSKLLY